MFIFSRVISLLLSYCPALLSNSLLHHYAVVGRVNDDDEYQIATHQIRFSSSTCANIRLWSALRPGPHCESSGGCYSTPHSRLVRGYPSPFFFPLDAFDASILGASFNSTCTASSFSTDYSGVVVCFVHHQAETELVSRQPSTPQRPSPNPPSRPLSQAPAVNPPQSASVDVTHNDSAATNFERTYRIMACSVSEEYVGAHCHILR